MPFVLKKLGATYKKIVNTMLVDKLKKIMGVYINDMVIKTTKGKSHLDSLQDLFISVAEYKMRSIQPSTSLGCTKENC